MKVSLLFLSRGSLTNEGIKENTVNFLFNILNLRWYCGTELSFVFVLISSAIPSRESRTGPQENNNFGPNVKQKKTTYR